jgi:cation:H+ antiporter
VRSIIAFVGNLVTKSALAAQVAAGSAWSAVWTFPAVLGSAILIAWGAEAAQFLISQGLALAILAWLQTLPEFAVEAVISYEAGQDPSKIHLMTANFTGSLRLLVGLGWPLIYVTAAYFNRRKRNSALGHIELENEHAIEVISLLPPILYFFVIWAKGSLEWVDSVVLIVIYIAYLYLLNKIPPQSDEKIEDIERIPRAILSRSPAARNSIIISLFVVGALILYFVAHPFLESMLGLAVSIGISQFVFVQWVSPFLSEFPEKVSAFYWAKKVHSAPMALMNMVSSNINQWTMLVAMLPLVYAYSHGSFAPIPFDDHQRLEIILTMGQSFLGMMLLANMRFSWWEAAVLFVLWAIQFVFSGLEAPPPGAGGINQFSRAIADALGTDAPAVERFAHAVKVAMVYVYFGWGVVEIALAVVGRRTAAAFRVFPRLLREHW